MATKNRPGSARRTIEEDAAVRGAEVEPVGRPADVATVVDLADAATRRADAAAAARAVAPDRWDVPPPDATEPYRDIPPASAVPLAMGGAIVDLARGALRLAATVATAPVRLALLLPRIALTALRLA